MRAEVITVDHDFSLKQAIAVKDDLIIGVGTNDEIKSFIGPRTRVLNLKRLDETLDWLAAMTSHVLNQGEQMVRYYGFYSKASRGHRQKENTDGLIPCVIEPEENARPNRNWARLIQKIGACPWFDLEGW